MISSQPTHSLSIGTLIMYRGEVGEPLPPVTVMGIVIETHPQDYDDITIYWINPEDFVDVATREHCVKSRSSHFLAVDEHRYELIE